MNQDPTYGRCADLDDKMHLLDQILGNFWCVVCEPTTDFIPVAIFATTMDAIDWKMTPPSAYDPKNKWEVMTLAHWREQFIDKERTP